MYLETKDLKSIPNYPYPYNLIELFDVADTEGYRFDISAGGIRRMIAELLTEQDARIIEYRYRDNLPREQIAEKLGMSVSNVEKREVHALNKMVSWENLRKYRSVPFEAFEREKQRRIEAEKKLDWLLSHTMFHSYLSGSNPFDKAFHDISIDNLNVSTRLASALKDGGFSSVYDILSNIKTEKELDKLKNAGAKTKKELLDVIHSYGLQFEWEG